MNFFTNPILKNSLKSQYKRLIIPFSKGGGELWTGNSPKEGFPGGPVEKNLTANAGNARDRDSIPGLGRSSPGVANSNLLHYSGLENSIDREAWWLLSMRSQRVRHDWPTEHIIPQRKSNWPIHSNIYMKIDLLWSQRSVNWTFTISHLSD